MAPSPKKRLIAPLAILALFALAFLGLRSLLSPAPPPAPGPGSPAAAVPAAEVKPEGTLTRLWRGIAGGAAAPAPEAERGAEVPGDGGEALAPETPLTIRVLGPDAPVPAEGATVFLDDQPLGVTDARGEVTIPYPVDGRRHDAWAEKGEAKAEAFFLREQNLPTGVLTLVLRGTGRIRGLVLGPDGAPVAGAELTLRPAAADPTVSGAGGAFDLGDLPEGGYEIVAATADGAASVWANVTAGSSQEVVLTLERARRLAGIVIDEAGAPLSGLHLDGQGIVLPALPQKLVTDAGGRFDLLARDGGRPVSLHVRGEGRLGEYQGPPREDLRIVAHAGGSAILLARRPGGEPVGQASLILLSSDPATGMQHFAQAVPVDPVEQPGRFRAEELMPGTWRVIEAGARQSERRDLATFELAAGEEKEVEVILPAGTGRVRGKVIDERSGRPVAGAQVRLGRARWEVGFEEADIHSRGTLTDAEGNFLFEAVDEEDRMLGIVAEGYQPRFTQAFPEGPEPAELHVIELTPARRVRGRVVDEKRLPLMEFFLNGEHLESSDGAFDEALPVTADRVTIAGYGRAEVVRELTPGPGDVDLGEVVLSASRPVQVRVFDPTGAPAVGARVIARGGPGHLGRVMDSPGTDREGWVQLILPPGNYVFSATHPRFGENEADVAREISGGETIELKLVAGAWIFGQAGGPGRLIVGSPGRNSTRSGPDGSYRIGPFSARQVDLQLELVGPGGTRSARRSPNLTLEPGEERRYDFDDPSRGVVRYLCAPGSEGWVVLQRMDGPHPRANASAAYGLGSGPCPVVFDGVEPGGYHLRAVRTNLGQIAEREAQDLVVDAGRTTEVEPAFPE
ncbi:MAG: carboxypeptidase regulatory-like domain-containing protein [Deltaproteobacteria bacterium]|nr:carboxypeptidase regulatory-like domain-containing protein [Deltaproteobacteria bacterium]